jgi:hypothetical protein
MSGVDYHEAAYACTHVIDGQPVLLVCRDAEPDDEWQLLCGGEGHDDPEVIRVVGIGHLIDADETLREVLDLKPYQEAERETVNGAWTRRAYDESN